MPTWILWLSPVPLSGLAAVLWNTWTSRDRGAAQAKESVEQYARFRKAMDAPDPARDPAATRLRKCPGAR
jgi:cytochrome c-type biogenesis protein CcmH/NrfF